MAVNGPVGWSNDRPAYTSKDYTMRSICIAIIIAAFCAGLVSCSSGLNMARVRYSPAFSHAGDSICISLALTDTSSGASALIPLACLRPSVTTPGDTAICFGASVRIAGSEIVVPSGCISLRTLLKLGIGPGK